MRNLNQGTFSGVNAHDIIYRHHIKQNEYRAKLDPEEVDGARGQKSDELGIGGSFWTGSQSPEVTLIHSESFILNCNKGPWCGFKSATNLYSYCMVWGGWVGGLPLPRWKVTQEKMFQISRSSVLRSQNSFCIRLLVCVWLPKEKSSKHLGRSSRCR